MVRGWISGDDPLTFDQHAGISDWNGLALFLCQVIIILTLCFLLGTAFKQLGQPRVVGELLAGVVLGPTAFGNIPGFSQTIVPTQALPLLSVTSNIGLIFFILIVGLETDTETIKQNARKVALIALPGMAIPFAVSVGLAQFIYQRLTDQSQAFTTFFLFVATVMAVTSLSVLSRIVSDLHLVNTLLGSMVIAAGALNDLIGYLLLALGSALAGGGKQINALYQLLVALALFLLQWFVIRPFMFWLIRRSTFDLNGSSKQRVPEGLLTFTLLGAMISAFVTQACGLHPILGALLFGIACPHGNFAVMVTEEIEVVAVQILLPLYFVSSGLKADFKLLNSGLVWGTLIMVFAVVYISKFTATCLSTRIASFTWRESAFVASLMQSKSIIELIILNAGREAGVLNAQVYSMLFVTFIFSTLTVRPLSLWIWRRGQAGSSSETDSGSHEKYSSTTNDETHDSQAAQTNDVEKHVQKHAKSISFVTALTSANPAMEPLTAFMQLAGRASLGRAPLTFDFVRYLPDDANLTSNILRQLHQHHDHILDAIKVIARMSRAHYIERNDRSDLITVASPDEVMSDLSLRLPQSNIRGTKNSEKGCEKVVLTVWDNNASQLAPASADLDHQTRTSLLFFAKANTMPAHMLHSLRRQTVGVLVERCGASVHARKSYGNADFLTLRRKHERQLGLLDEQQRRPRIVIPFFGGSDDRACVKLARAMAEGVGQATANVVIVKVDNKASAVSEKVLQELLATLPSSHDEASDRGANKHHTRTASALQRHMNEDVNLMTVNVLSGNVEAERNADARALFGMTITEEEGENGVREMDEEGSVANEDQHATTTEKTTRVERLDDCVAVVTLCAADVEQTSTQTPLEAVLQYCATLMIAQAGDMIFVGRGKLHQRTADFRSQLTALQAAKRADVVRHGHANEQDSHAASSSVRQIGRVLGACCEAVLSVVEMDANVLVMQSGTANNGNGNDEEEENDYDD